MATAKTMAVFEKGPFSTTNMRVDPKDTCSPPKPLLIVRPTEEGTYPVVLFFHGFYLYNYFYSQLLSHVASHGYIVVAPQLYGIIPSSGTDEVADAGKVANWISNALQLQTILSPHNIKPNLDQLALTGHSRGGKVAFSLVLGLANTPSLRFTSLIAIDPVAGSSKSIRTDPKILTYKPRSFNLNKTPVTVIGTGLGPETKNCVPIPCAPDGVNHQEFYDECKATRAHFVAAEYGHMDMLDDGLEGVVGRLAGCLCKNGKGSKDLMRRFVGGIIVAFIKYSCGSNERLDFLSIVQDPFLAPVKVFPAPEFDLASI